MSASVQTFEQFGKTCFEISGNIEKVVIDTINQVADGALSAITGNAPVDTGNLRNNIVKQGREAGTVAVSANADYSIFVDKGHHTRSGSMVPANPFFSSVIDIIKNGLLVQALQENLALTIQRKPPSKAIGYKISQKTGKKYAVYAKKDTLGSRRTGRIRVR